MKAKKIATASLLVALAMICSYIEVLLPLPVPVPGIKLGLANAVILFALYRLNVPYAVAISVLRILLVSLLFGNGFALLYSLSGGACSLLVMVLLRRSDRFSPIGVSIAGGIAHNLGQTATAAVCLGTRAIWSYFPVLLLSGIVTGALIGLLAGLLLRRLSENK